MKRLRKKIIVCMLCACILCGNLYALKLQVEAVAETVAIDLMEAFTTILLTMGVAIYIDTVIQNPDTGVLNPPTGWQDWDEYNIVSWQWCYLLNMEEAGGSGTDPGDPEDPDNKDKTGSKFWQWLQQYKVPASAVGISMPMVLYMAIKERSKQVVDRYGSINNVWWAPLVLSEKQYFNDLTGSFLDETVTSFTGTSTNSAGNIFLDYCVENNLMISGFVIDMIETATSRNNYSGVEVGDKLYTRYVIYVAADEAVRITSTSTITTNWSDGTKDYMIKLRFDKTIKKALEFYKVTKIESEGYKFGDKYGKDIGGIIFNPQGFYYLTFSKDLDEAIGGYFARREQQIADRNMFMWGSMLDLPVDASVKDETLLDPDMIAVTPGLEVTPEGEIAGDLELEIPENLPELIEKTKTGEITLPEFSEEVGITPTPKPDIPQTPVVPPAPPAVDDPEEPPEGLEPYVVDLRKIFPFCIPFDFYDFMMCLSAEPEAPHFSFRMPTGYVDGEVIYTEYEMDLSQFDEVALNVRRMELFAFIIGLMFLTRQVFIRS